LLVSFCWLCLFLRNDCRVHRVEINSLFELLLVWKELLVLESIFLQDQVVFTCLVVFTQSLFYIPKAKMVGEKVKLESIIKKLDLYMDQTNCFQWVQKLKLIFIICQSWQKSIPTKVINTLPIGLVWPHIFR
jgi:hypothetical protein